MHNETGMEKVRHAIRNNLYPQGSLHTKDVLSNNLYYDEDILFYILVLVPGFEPGSSPREGDMMEPNYTTRAIS